MDDLGEGPAQGGAGQKEGAAARGALPRPEYPRPILVRPRWLNLNGAWELAYDPEDRGLAEGWEQGRRFERRVVVPFPLESELSQVGDPSPPPIVWYRRRFALPSGWAGARTLLRIGACDFETRVFVNGRGVGHHRGGYAPIACEVGHALRAGENELVLRVEDPPVWTRPRGKQAAGAFRTPVDYDTVTGIWQTVWLEPLPDVSIEEVFTRYRCAGSELAVHVVLSAPAALRVEAVLAAGGREVARAEAAPLGRELALRMQVPAPRLWHPADPFLYDLRVRLLRDGRELDAVASYAGLREVGTAEGRLTLNGEPFFLRGVLDQGYFPGGWYTAASDAALRRDVELVLALGMNTARKHQKAEDPRWLHFADRLGLLVFAEMPSGREFGSELVTDLSREWGALVRRDRAHPSVIAWVPFNESWGVWRQAERPEQRAFVEAMVGVTRALDPTRLVVGNDGWEFAAGDLFTLHLYAGETEALAGDLARLLRDPHADVLPPGQPLGRRRGALPGADPAGLPVLVSECGGIGFIEPGAPRPEGLFVYGPLPETPEAFEARIRQVLAALAGSRRLAGFVWTQLTDVQQEVNGLLGFDRRPKLPLERLRALFSAVGSPRV
jgi:hypothetical protein